MVETGCIVLRFLLLAYPYLQLPIRRKVYPFDELEKAPQRFIDEFQGQAFDVLFDPDNKTARIVDDDGAEISTTLAY